MNDAYPQAQEKTLQASGLSHHVVEWGSGPETIVLCHGFLDFAWSWRWVAEQLADAGFRVVAFDWRGHGESEWIGPGGYYHFPDYVRDLAALLPQFATSDVHLVGHSMGGTACALYAGAIGKHIQSLTLIEGWGMEDGLAQQAPERLAQWTQASLSQPPKREDRATGAAKNAKMVTLSDAVRRLRIVHSGVSQQVCTFLAEKGTVHTPDGLRWRFDPLHRTPSASLFSAASFEASLRAIAVPVLAIVGEHGLRLQCEVRRLGHLDTHSHVELAGEGHMMHWTAPTRLGKEISGWLHQARSVNL